MLARPLFVLFLLILTAACSAVSSAPETPSPSAVSGLSAAVKQQISETPTIAPIPISTVTSAATTANGEERFAGQRSRFVAELQTTAPTVAASVDIEGQYGQWILSNTNLPRQDTSLYYLESTRSVSNDFSESKQQRYTCAIYTLGKQIPRVNVRYDRELSYTVVTNQYGELQGKVRTVTTVNGEPVQVEWLTWTSRTDRLRLREDDAIRLVQSIQDGQATEFRLELIDDPELSASLDVTDLVVAMSANDMSCFTPN